MARTVVVFDVCSSSVILEDLQRTDTLDKYGLLVDAIWNYLSLEANHLGFTIYKFQGDGFILIFPPHISADDVMVFLLYLVHYCNAVIRTFLDNYVQLAKLPRVGITIGIDVGPVHPLNSNAADHDEFFGRPLNLASRFQGSLKRPDQVNHVLVSGPFYTSISDRLLRGYFRHTTRAFHNIAEDQELKCWYLNMTQFAAGGDVFFDANIAKLAGALKDPGLIQVLTPSTANVRELQKLVVEAVNTKLEQMRSNEDDAET